MKRFQRLIQPATAVIITCSVVGAVAGFNYALNARFNELRRAYNVPASEWDEYKGEVWMLLPDMTMTVAVFTILGILLAPDTVRGDRARIRELARHKLSQSYLTEAELQQWTSILEEVEGGDRHES